MIYPESVESLDEYVYYLGASGFLIEAIYNLQRQALKLNLLNVDEQEQSQTIAYECSRLFHCIEGLLKIMEDRAVIDAAMVAKRLQKKIKPPKKITKLKKITPKEK